MLVAALSAVLPAPLLADAPAPSVSDEQVARAIRRGLDYLYAAQQPDGTWDTKYSRQHPGGTACLIALTALSAGEGVNRPPVRRAVEAIDRLDPRTVYVRAFRTMVYARTDREGDDRRLREDVGWLLKQQLRNGGWGYGPGHPTTQLRPSWTDTSNSQLVMLALRDAADAGAYVPPGVWRQARRFWSSAQNTDGGWGYEPPGSGPTRLRASSYGSMTAAGVATFFILADFDASTEPPYDEQSSRRENPIPSRTDLQAGLDWLAKHYAVDEVPGWVWGSSEDWLYYYLYCLERVADAGGLRMIGPHDWYPDVARRLLAEQNDDGSWADPRDPRKGPGDWKDAPVRTCFALLSLVKGRAPVLINKLALDGRWGNDCRDAANLARWYSRELESPVTWQMIDADSPEGVLREAPILYVTGSGDAELPDALGKRIRRFVLGGGVVLVQPFGGDETFAARARTRLLGLLPGFRAAPLPTDHPLFGGMYHDIPAGERPRVTGIGDAGRFLVFILESDLSGAWHQDRTRDKAATFHFAANLGLYATDRRPPPGKLAARREEAGVGEAVRNATAARVKHDGAWDICTGSIAAVSDTLARSLSIALVPDSPVDLSGPPPAADLLWITGADSLTLSDAQRENLVEYVRKGGTVLIEPAYGGEGFAERAVELMNLAFGPDSVQTIEQDDPLVSGAFASGMGADLRSSRFTSIVAAAHPQLRTPPLWGVRADGRWGVVISRYGLSCTLTGSATYGVAALSAGDARRLAANVVLQALSRE